MVVFKVVIVLFVILGGIAFINPANYQPFLPYGFFGISFFGQTAIGGTDTRGDSVGVLAATSIVFFAFIGFDAVSTQAEECENPQRDMPIGIVGSLLISTILYVSVALVLVGMVPYQQIDRDAPLSSAFGDHGMKWAQIIISFGALAGLSSVMLVNLLGQPRILMAMARDGLLPKEFFSDIHPVFRTPYRSTALTGLFVATVGALVPLSVLVELVSMGTLMAFGFVNVSVSILRRTKPDLPRPFKCPYCPWVPGVGALSCFLLMLSLPSTNWVRLVVWFLVGMCIYKFYSVPNMARIASEAAEAKDRKMREGYSVDQVLSPLH
jgi:APA family basic amino acid/polyamine antiporter